MAGLTVVHVAAAVQAC